MKRWRSTNVWLSLQFHVVQFFATKLQKRGMMITCWNWKVHDLGPLDRWKLQYLQNISARISRIHLPKLYMAEWLAHTLFIREIRDSSYGKQAGHTDRRFRGFPSSSYNNFGHLKLGNDSFLPHHFHFIILNTYYPFIYLFIYWFVCGVFNDPVKVYNVEW
jgi:hypothetical protein